MLYHRRVVICVLVVLVAGLAIWLWTGDQRAIQRQLHLIETSGSKNLAEDTIEALVRAKGITMLFHEPCALTAEAYQYSGNADHRQILERIMHIRSVFQTLTVSVSQRVIEFPGKEQAKVQALVRLTGKVGGEAVAERHQVTALLRKIKGQWLFTEVRLVESLEEVQPPVKASASPEEHQGHGR